MKTVLCNQGCSTIKTKPFNYNNSLTQQQQQQQQHNSTTTTQHAAVHRPVDPKPNRGVVARGIHRRRYCQTDEREPD